MRSALRSARVLVATLVAAAICGVVPPAPSLAFAQERQRVERVDVDGLVRMDIQAVRAKILTRPGDLYDPSRVSEDIKRLWAMGFFDDVQVYTADGKTPGQIVLRYVVLERRVIASHDYEGNDELTLEELKKVVDLKPQALLSLADVIRNVRKIQDLYIEEGYYLATVKHRIDLVDPQTVKVVFVIEEQSKVKVRSITFVGNTSVPDDDLKGVMRTQEGSLLSFLSKGGAFKREFFDNDLNILQYLYLTKGHIQARVRDPVVKLSTDRRFIDITLYVDEGPQFKVGKIDVEGDSPIPKADMLAVVKLKSGEVFDYSKVHDDTVALGDLLKDLGYANVDVSNQSVPNVETKIVDWSYRIQKGAKVYFGQVRMKGNDSTRDKVLRRELTFQEGDLYSSTKIKRSKALVQRLGFFDKVELKTRPTNRDDVVDVVVEVKERTTGTFQVGAGFSSVDNFITTAQISKDNFLGRGQTLSFQATLSSIRTLFISSFFEPYFLDTNVTFAFELFNFDQLYTDFSRTSTGGNLTWGYRFWDVFMASITYNLERIKTSIGGFSGRESVPIAGLLDAGFNSSVRLTLTYDTRDDRMFPNTGWFIQGTSEFALAEFGSSFPFNRYVVKARRFFPLPLGAVLRLGAVTGVITAPGTIPLFERFFVGGIFTVRGFTRNSLGARVPVPSSTSPDSPSSLFNEGGNKQLYFNNEIEVPIVGPPVNLRGVVFFDAGNAFAPGAPIALFDLRSSFGWGIRWFSPVGPLRFEWGVPLKPLPGEQPIVFEFTIGNSF